MGICLGMRQLRPPELHVRLRVVLFVPSRHLALPGRARVFGTISDPGSRPAIPTPSGFGRRPASVIPVLQMARLLRYRQLNHRGRSSP